MFQNQLTTAIAVARTLAQLNQLSLAIWQAHGSGGIGDDDAQNAAELLEARRRIMRGEVKPVGIPPGRNSIFPPRKPQRAPTKPIALARRRQLAAAGPMPPALAAGFTMGEMAVLKIVADEVGVTGSCARTLAEIAARTGCS